MANLFLPSLPVCPHCKTIYRYGDVRKLIFKKEQECYHCKKRFKISKKKLIVMSIEYLIVLIAVNLLLIGFAGVNLITLFIINVVLTALALTLVPYYILFVEKK